jgi:hypothetical protein
MLDVFCGWRLQTLIQNGGELLAVQCFNGVKKFAYDVFLFLVCFVALQVMMKGTMWVSFWDGV